jgi:RimJ/RimL family protein N-acetyltransferase
MRWHLAPVVTKSLQGIFWIYLTNNFVVTGSNDFKTIEPLVKCEFLPISEGNYFRVREFRAESRVQEYREKLARQEVGFFAACDGKVVGSIWATVNNTGDQRVARTYMKLGPNEALVHDVVTRKEFRGKGIGAFMVGKISTSLLNERGVSKIVIDVNVRNGSSLRMMEKAGLQINQQTLSVSVFGKLISHRLVKQYPDRSGRPVGDSGFHACTPSDL